jgi:hypothetical protein
VNLSNAVVGVRVVLARRTFCPIRFLTRCHACSMARRSGRSHRARTRIVFNPAIPTGTAPVDKAVQWGLRVLRAPSASVAANHRGMATAAIC